MSESPEKIVVITDPEDTTKFAEIKRSNIEEIIPASESLMPKGLLDQLNEREVVDLIAYTLARGNKNDGRFKKP